MRTIVKINTAVAATLIVFAALSTMAYAQEASGGVEDAPAGSTFEQRLTQRKAEQGITLEDKDSKRIISTCVNAQAKVRTTQSSAAQALSTRAKTYERIDGRLWTIIGKLKLAEKDTFEFEKQRLEFSDKIDVFNATGNNYKQALDDLAVINCKSDPEGFKALLETARFYGTKLREDAAELKAISVDTLKPSLSAFASELQGGSKATSNNDADSNESSEE